MSWNSPDDMPSSSGEDDSSGSCDSHDDALSLKFKAECNFSSDDDGHDAGDSPGIDQGRRFQVCFPDLDDLSSEPSGGHAASATSAYTFNHDVTATAPRVFAIDEHACVAGYGDGSLRLQQMQPIFSRKNNTLAARCSSTVVCPLSCPCCIHGLTRMCSAVIPQSHCMSRPSWSIHTF
jgi:hypothetical protein